MASENLIILIGHVGKDPDVRNFDNGGKVANFTLATSERYTDRAGEQKEDTQWHNIVVAGKSADFVEQYIGKGRLLYVKGKLRYRKYTTNDGTERSIAEILAREVRALDKADNTSGQQAAAPQAQAQYEESLEPQTDDLPF
jgi:single-strand DNA-binding protein